MFLARRQALNSGRQGYRLKRRTPAQALREALGRASSRLYLQMRIFLLPSNASLRVTVLMNPNSSRKVQPESLLLVLPQSR